MSQHEKLLEKLLKKPKNFTWDELKRVLGGFGYEETTGGKTGGSRRRFEAKDLPSIILHEPHPQKELKTYQIAQIITFLKVNRIMEKGE